MRSGHPGHRALLEYDGAPEAARNRVRRHVADCARCRARLGAIRDIRRGAKIVGSPPVPTGLWARIQATLDAGETRLLPELGSPVGGLAGSGRRLPRIAALLLIGAAGGAAAAVAGPPLLDRLRVADRDPAVAPTAPLSSGIAVAVPEGGVRIRVLGADPALGLRIELVDGSLLEVVGSGGAASATFRFGGGVLTIRGPGAGELHVALPRGAGPAVLEVHGRDVVTSDGRRLVVLGETVAGSEARLRLSRGAGGADR